MTRPPSLPAALEQAAFRLRLEREILPGYIPGCRWYRSKARKVEKVALEAWAALSSPESGVLAAIRVEMDKGEPEQYVLPLAVLGPEAKELPPQARLAAWDGESEAFLCDASWSQAFRRDFLAALFSPGMPWGDGILRGQPREGWKGIPPDGPSRLLSGEQSNTAFAFDSGHFLKLYRRLEEAVNPEPEVLRFLQEHTDFQGIPEFISELTWERGGRPPVTVALLQGFVPGDGNAWDHVLKELAAVLARPGASLPAGLRQWLGRLGQASGELHRALGSAAGLPDFAPESMAPEDVSALAASAAFTLDRTLEALELSDLAVKDTEVFRAARARRDRLQTLLTREQPGDLGRKIRVHGDYHLGQVLCSGPDLRILDFEGEPSRSAAERRRKHSPLRDVAGMLRSFHYAAHAAGREAARGGARYPGDARVEALNRGLCAPFLEAYYAALEGSGLLPGAAADREVLLRLFILDKAVYELHYELNNRPDWVDIPLRGLLALSEG